MFVFVTQTHIIYFLFFNIHLSKRFSHISLEGKRVLTLSTCKPKAIHNPRNIKILNCFLMGSEMAISDKTTQCKRSIDKEQSVFISISIKKSCLACQKLFLYTSNNDKKCCSSKKILMFAKVFEAIRPPSHRANIQLIPQIPQSK